MFRLSLSRFSSLGTLQSRPATIEGDEATLDAARTLDSAARAAGFSGPVSGTLDATACLAAAPDYFVPGMRRFGLSLFSVLGTLQSRPAAIISAEATVTASRNPSTFADRAGAFAAGRAIAEGRALAHPDLSPGVTVTFEEVYSI